MSHTITRAVVATGGAGTKMSPITRILPKEMLPAGGKPILEHLVHELQAAQITDVLFVISSRKPQTPAYFGSGAAYGMDFSYRVQDDGAGPGAPILAAETWTAGQPFVHAFPRGSSTRWA
ncbi:sugar phosphate nucleotidyltransferase [Streptomyces sp. NBC_00654]|uniref:sugar phosphate nucleotidyltransferase n=1 Tax=Streptomyces sp. NBC_00654 TaxID=2975799 RepID=UPI002259FE4E|nr:sugar phosphate nucleotidyltransferase [Streptomyces sp. NBC_00654]MCX4966282.1 sugar phosphate nucleotidyltransferase [Streptomyces sp. NBC_00654]